MNIKPVIPAIEYKVQFMDMVEDLKKQNENHMNKIAEEDFKKFVNYLDMRIFQGINHTFRARQYTFWYFVDDIIVGTGRLRTKSVLCRNGRNSGHVGYDVRPSERRKGYATEILSHLIEEAGKLKIDSMEINCSSDNIGSIKTIENNGGCLKSKTKIMLSYIVNCKQRSI